MVIAVRPENFAADAVVEAGDETGQDLFDLREAVKRGLGNHEGRMAGMVVKVNDLADVVETGRCLQQQSFAFAVAMEGLELVEKLGGNARDLLIVSLV